MHYFGIIFFSLTFFLAGIGREGNSKRILQLFLKYKLEKFSSDVINDSIEFSRFNMQSVVR